MLAIKNNLMASNAARHLGRAYDSLSTSVERLASGLRINSAKDDAAGLAVRELIRADIAVLQQGSRNAQDGISMIQTMEGAMAVIDENLIRMKELAEQAATGSYSTAQRAIMNAEFSEMADEIDRIATNTKFNDISMLNGSGTVSIHVGTSSTIDIDKVDMTKEGLEINTGVEVVGATFNGAVAAATDNYITVATEAVTLNFNFTNTGGVNEPDIAVSFGVGSHTLASVVSQINDVSENLPFAADGTDQRFTAAEVVTNDDGTFSLKVSSRLEASGLAVTALSSGGTGDVDFLSATAGTDVTNALAGGSVVNADNYAAVPVEGGLNIATAAAAAAALDTITAAINTKDEARASFGYKMNRLESTIAIIDIQAENLMTAESRISDVDVAIEMATLTRTQVLSQAGISMLAQANQMPQMALSLLR